MQPDLPPKKVNQSMDLSCKGLKTKIHALIDGLGMLACFSLINGQATESIEALPVVGELKNLSLAADKAYNTNAILQHLKLLSI